MSSTACSIRLAGVEPESIVDGPGFRFAIFVQGCPHHCPGCHNPQTHDFSGGYLTDIDALYREIAANAYLSGVTFSGGEPFCQSAPLAQLGQRVHALGKSVITYTGYTLEQLLDKAKAEPDIAALLRQTDVLIDGPFLLEQRDLSLDFRGSRNQRIIEMKSIPLP